MEEREKREGGRKEGRREGENNCNFIFFSDPFNNVAILYECSIKSNRMINRSQYMYETYIFLFTIELRNSYNILTFISIHYLYAPVQYSRLNLFNVVTRRDRGMEPSCVRIIYIIHIIYVYILVQYFDLICKLISVKSA